MMEFAQPTSTIVEGVLKLDPLLALMNKWEVGIFDKKNKMKEYEVDMAIWNEGLLDIKNEIETIFLENSSFDSTFTGRILTNNLYLLFGI